MGAGNVSRMSAVDQTCTPASARPRSAVEDATVRHAVEESGDEEELLPDVDPRTSRNPRAHPCGAQSGLPLGLPDHRSVGRIPVADPEHAAVLAELEVDLGHRTSRVVDRDERVEILSGLRNGATTDQPCPVDGDTLTRAEMQRETRRGDPCPFRHPG